RRLSESPLFDEQEHRQILAWGWPDKEFFRDECLHQWFATQVGRRPDAVAVVEEEEQLTYAALDRRSNRLARYLRGIGVGPEKIVGLYLPRSARMVEAMLGTLKAGGAYLPLDTASPAERVRLMVEDAGAVVALSETGEEEQLEDLGCAGVGVAS